MATETLSRERVLEIIEECGGDKEHLLSILIEIQRECRRNYINEASARVVAEKLDIPLVQLYDILTFYAMLEPSRADATSSRCATTLRAMFPNPTSWQSSCARSWELLWGNHAGRHVQPAVYAVRRRLQYRAGHQDWG